MVDQIGLAEGIKIIRIFINAAVYTRDLLGRNELEVAKDTKRYPFRMAFTDSGLRNATVPQQASKYMRVVESDV